MKKVLSIVLSVAMLMTVACSMFVMPASAAEPAAPISFLAESYIAEGAENVTVNEDGSFTATGSFALSPKITFDYTTYKYVEIVIETDVDIKVSFLDRDPRSEDEDTTNDADSYGDHWITFESEWYAKNGGFLTPTDGLISYTGTQGGLYSIYNWCVNNSGWKNTGTATARALYITPATEGVTYTVRTLGVTDGSTNVDFGAAAYTYDTEVDLAVKDATAWTLQAAGDSNPAIEVVDNALVFSNTAGLWPSAYINYAEPLVVDNTAMLYVDFTVAYDAATTIYLYCGDASDANTYAGDMSNVITVHVADMGPGNYKGYITLADIAPAATENGTCFDADGNLQINAIRVYSTTNGGAATPLNPTVTVRDIKLCYTAPVDDVLLGDVNGDGVINTRDVLKVYKAVKGGGELTEEEFALADMNGDGNVNTRDVLSLYKTVKGV